MSLGPQFDSERLEQALALSPEERRLRGFTARKQAAQRDATRWAFAVDHSSHNDLKDGVVAKSTSRVVLSRDEFPDALDAGAAAYEWGISRGTYPTSVRIQTE